LRKARKAQLLNLRRPKEVKLGDGTRAGDHTTRKDFLWGTSWRGQELAKGDVAYLRKNREWGWEKGLCKRGKLRRVHYALGRREGKGNTPGKGENRPPSGKPGRGKDHTKEKFATDRRGGSRGLLQILLHQRRKRRESQGKGDNPEAT